MSFLTNINNDTIVFNIYKIYKLIYITFILLYIFCYIFYFTSIHTSTHCIKHINIYSFIFFKQIIIDIYLFKNTKKVPV